MGEIWKLLLDSVKWLTSLRTAAQQLVAALFLLVGILMGTVYFLYKQNISDRAEFAAREELIRQQGRADLAAQVLKTDAAMKAATDCMNEKYNIINELFLEQRAINRQEQPLVERRQKLANTNKRYINSIKKDTKDLVEQVIQQRKQ